MKTKIKDFDYKYYSKQQPLTNFDILNQKSGIKYFRGVFMRDNLPIKPKMNECGIVNLDSTNNTGTHWVCYFIGKKSYYFDSFGLNPPNEIENYLLIDHNNFLRSSFVLQEYNSTYCGHLCLYLLRNLSKGYKFEDIVLNLFENYEKIYNK